MSKLNRYQQYLAYDGVLKAFENAEVLTDGRVSMRAPSKLEREQFAELLNGEVEIDQGNQYWYYSYIYGNTDIQVRLQLPPESWDWTDEEKQAEREAALFSLMKQLPGAIAVRHQGSAYLIGKMHGGTYEISIGQALCERVVVGTKTVKKPANPEMVQAFMATVEQIEEEEPIYEWRCNDAELAAGMI